MIRPTSISVVLLVLVLLVVSVMWRIFTPLLLAFVVVVASTMAVVVVIATLVRPAATVAVVATATVAGLVMPTVGVAPVGFLLACLPPSFFCDAQDLQRLIVFVAQYLVASRVLPRDCRDHFVVGGQQIYAVDALVCYRNLLELDECRRC